MSTGKAAPKFLNLTLIKLPPGGVASIGHRISGVLMFLCVPLAAWLLALSLQGEAGFARALACLHSLPLRLLSLLLVWSLSHHLLAGIRHLLLDVGLGVGRPCARASARVVNFGALAITALYLASLL